MGCEHSRKSKESPPGPLGLASLPDPQPGPVLSWLFLSWPSQHCHQGTKNVCSNTHADHSILPVAIIISHGPHGNLKYEDHTSEERKHRELRCLVQEHIAGEQIYVDSVPYVLNQLWLQDSREDSSLLFLRHVHLPRPTLLHLPILHPKEMPQNKPW